MFGLPAAPASTSAGSAPAPAPFDFSQLFGAMPGAGAGAGAGAAPGNPFAAMMQQMAGAGAPAAARVPAASATPEHLRPEILYREQLSQLNELGFVDFEANINALVSTGGNVQAAINRLLS